MGGGEPPPIVFCRQPDPLGVHTKLRIGTNRREASVRLYGDVTQPGVDVGTFFRVVVVYSPNGRAVRPRHLVVTRTGLMVRFWPASSIRHRRCERRRRQLCRTRSNRKVHRPHRAIRPVFDVSAGGREPRYAGERTARRAVDRWRRAPDVQPVWPRDSRSSGGRTSDTVLTRVLRSKAPSVESVIGVRAVDPCRLAGPLEITSVRSCRRTRHHISRRAIFKRIHVRRVSDIRCIRYYATCARNNSYTNTTKCKQCAIMFER